MAGMDSLKAHIEVELPRFGICSGSLYANVETLAARKNFHLWVDHISEVNDKTIIKKLDQKIIEHLRTKTIKDAGWLAPRLWIGQT